VPAASLRPDADRAFDLYRRGAAVDDATSTYNLGALSSQESS
jgi:hypothetical protein